jgi:copper chaperone CopZ
MSKAYRILAIGLSILALVGSFMVFPPQEVGAAKRTVKKYKIKRKSRRLYYRKRTSFKAYQEYFLSPAIKEMDVPVIEESLKDKGVSTVKVDLADNSLILQFKASEVSALDLILALKDLGYTVTSIN